MRKKVTAVLPVRLDSSRITHKALVELQGKPLLWHAWNQVIRSACFSKILITTDAPQISALVQSWGGTVVLSPPGMQNGTERIAAVLDQIETDFIVNVQADMPCIAPGIFTGLLTHWDACDAEVITPVYQINDEQDLANRDLVKVARATNGQALYFSRHPIPFQRDEPLQQRWLHDGTYWGHVGIYGFTRSALQKYREAPAGFCERAESLEQLRFLELQVPVMTFVTPTPPLRIDSLDDLARVQQAMQ